MYKDIKESLDYARNMLKETQTDINNLVIQH